jgi:hypothetical protein
MEWNRWPDSTGMGGRNGMEQVAGLPRNTQMIDWGRPYHEESRFPYPRYLLQDGFWYDPDKGVLVNPAPR